MIAQVRFSGPAVVEERCGNRLPYGRGSVTLLLNRDRKGVGCPAFFNTPEFLLLDIYE